MAKPALLIGINRYQVAGADLRGCVNDVLKAKKFDQVPQLEGRRARFDRPLFSA